MDARDLERQLTLLRADVYASPYVYRQRFLVGHSHIDLCRSMFGAALYARKIILAYAHDHVAVLVAAARALDTVGAVEA
jgi:hypothetical protein